MKEFRIYRPNKKNNGSAAKFQFSEKEKNRNGKVYKDRMVFLELSKQTGVDIMVMLLLIGIIL